jgi:SAM-dependent methyltransferase
VSTLERHLSRQAERSQSFFWNRLRWDLVCEHLPRTGEVELVDVGAGPGFLGDRLRLRHPNVAYRYIEPLAGLEQSLADRFGADANMRDREQYDGAEFVTLLDVLEHQADDRLFLRELAAKMRPGAILLLTVPAMPSLWSDWDVALGHHRRYKKASLLIAIEGLPLEPVEVDYLFPELLPLGWLRRLRMRSSAMEAAAEGEAEFPELPRWLNGTLYGLGRGSMRLRKVWPAGTSLFASLRRSG